MAADEKNLIINVSGVNLFCLKKSLYNNNNNNNNNNNKFIGYLVAIYDSSSVIRYVYQLIWYSKTDIN